MTVQEKQSNEYYLKLYHLQDEVLKIIHLWGLPFYLGGGTALSRFYFQHRYSDDLDFFSLPDADFITSVQESHCRLADQGFEVSIFGFSENFARFSVTEPKQFPGMKLKVDFIRPHENSHTGEFRTVDIFPKIDNPRNILAEKLTYIYKKSPKDIADIWITCKNISFFWEEVILFASVKRTTDPLFIAEMLGQFNATSLNHVLWINPINIEDFERDREIIIKNIITKDFNRLIHP